MDSLAAQLQQLADRVDREAGRPEEVEALQVEGGGGGRQAGALPSPLLWPFLALCSGTAVS